MQLFFELCYKDGKIKPLRKGKREINGTLFLLFRHPHIHISHKPPDAAVEI